MKLGQIYNQLVENDFEVLRAIESLLRGREFVPLDALSVRVGLPEERLSLILFKLHKLGLVKKRRVGDRLSYSLTYLGLDMLSLRSFVEMGILSAVGDRIGVGKESDMFEALTPSGEKVVVKFLRLGRASFRKTRLVRGWASAPDLKWLEESKVAAEREFCALRELSLQGALVPRPLGRSRHAIVIQFIDGVELYRRPPLSSPPLVLRQILDTIKTAYIKVGIVHGDLSEYNIMISRDDEKPYIIDWPQYVYRDHPNAGALLKRDVEYVLKFFKKVYGTSANLDEALNYITSADSSDSPLASEGA